MTPIRLIIKVYATSKYPFHSVDFNLVKVHKTPNKANNSPIKFLLTV